MSRDPITNRSALSTRATMLQAEIAKGFDAPSKRRLKHTEAMDILARIEGFRNREAAQAAEAETDAVALETAKATATETFDPRSAYFEFAIPFEDGMGFLGARTNGAPPQSVDGISVECSADARAEDILDPDWIEEAAAGFWLRATYGKRQENVAYVTGWKQARALLAMIIEAEYHGSECAMLNVTAYPNDAQLEFAGDEAEEGPDDDVRFICKPLRGGFELSATAISDRRSPANLRRDTVARRPVIARLEGAIGKAGLHELSRRLQEANDWFAARRHERHARLRALAETDRAG